MGWLITPMFGVPRLGWIIAGLGVLWLITRNRQQPDADTSIQPTRHPGRNYRTTSKRARRS